MSADWKSFSLQVPGKDLLQPVRQVLETLLIFLDILKAILNTIKAFLIDFGNPIKALVEALIKLIEEFFLVLKVQGFFGYFDVPNPDIDPGFIRNAGGFPAFITRFKASLFDTKDFNRPQPRPGSTESGFILLVVDATDPVILIRRMRGLLRFFGKDLTAPRYEAPGNLKVIPVGQSGDPILALQSVFTDGPIKAIQLSWTLASSQTTPTPGFTDAVVQYASEFIPPSWIVERSEVNPSSQKIDLSQMGDAAATGIVEWDRTAAVDPRLAGRFGKIVDGRVVRRDTLRDIAGEPIIKFQKYFTPGVATDVTGALGRFRYIDTDVEPGKTYYYRVRAYSGDLDINETTHQLNGLPTKSEELESGIASNQKSGVFSYPSKTADDPITMGKSSPIIRTTIPKQGTADFDVLENVRRVFMSSFSLDFHQEKMVGAQFNGDGTPKSGTPATAVGRGSLLDQAGILAAFQSSSVLEFLADFETVGAAIDPANAVVPVQMPWTKYNLRRQTSRLTDGVVMSMLQHSDAPGTFQAFMQGPLPRGPISTQGNLAGKNTLEEIVFALTASSTDDDGALGDLANLSGASQFNGGTVDAAGVSTYVTAYSDVALRLNLLTVVNFFHTFAIGGTPVDWLSVSPLRDIIPWSGQFLYDLLDKIQALLDAFSGTIEEIKQFIELLERKINALEQFIQFLLEILNFIESLSLSFYFLSASGLSGDAFSWVDAIDTATGTPPPSGADGYTAGISLAYVSPNPEAFEAAFALIFGA